jgi:hypothetical protein
MGEAQAATAPEGARRGRSTDPASAVFKGQERSTGIPNDEEAIAQLRHGGRDQGYADKGVGRGAHFCDHTEESVANGAAAPFRRAAACLIACGSE